LLNKVRFLQNLICKEALVFQVYKLNNKATTFLTKVLKFGKYLEHGIYKKTCQFLEQGITLNPKLS